jgi:hypothetical protein
MNKSPFRRIYEVADIGPESVYGKIRFIHGQCLAFAADESGQNQSQLRDPFQPLAAVLLDRKSALKPAQ